MNQTKVLNELATEQGGWIPSGYVWFKVQLTTAKVEGDYLLVQLGWIGLKELTALMEFANQAGWQGFKNDIGELFTKAPDQTKVLSLPVCREHNKVMSKSKFKDEYICTCRKNGGFCSVTAKLGENNQFIYSGG